MAKFGVFQINEPVSISFGNHELSLPAGRFVPETAEDAAALLHHAEYEVRRRERNEETRQIRAVGDPIVKLLEAADPPEEAPPADSRPPPERTLPEPPAPRAAPVPPPASAPSPAPAPDEEDAHR